MKLSSIKWWPWQRTIIQRGTDICYYSLAEGYWYVGPRPTYNRDYVVYKIVNHWTGSERLKKIYLD